MSGCHFFLPLLSPLLLIECEIALLSDDDADELALLLLSYQWWTLTTLSDHAVLSLSLSPRHTVLLYWVTKVHKSFHLFSRFHVWGDLTLEIQLIYSGFFPLLSLSLTYSLSTWSSFFFFSFFIFISLFSFWKIKLLEFQRFTTISFLYKFSSFSFSTSSPS